MGRLVDEGVAMSDTTSRLAFCTLGMPGESLASVAALARRTGWCGVELRSAVDEPVHVGMSAGDVERARRDLEGVVVVATDSYVKVGSVGQHDDEIVDAALAEATLALSLGTTAVRVFPGDEAESGTSTYVDREEAMIRRLAAAAERLPDGVELWLETHGSYRTGEAVARVLAAVDDLRVRAIWDIAHPGKAGERWQRTLEQLRPYLAHVQIKDERPGQVPMFLGEGDVPITEIVGALESGGDSGWYSLKYERKWHPESPPLEDALTSGSDWWRDQGL